MRQGRPLVEMVVPPGAENTVAAPQGGTATVFPKHLGSILAGKAACPFMESYGAEADCWVRVPALL
jgi:hypothetical protein